MGTEKKALPSELTFEDRLQLRVEVERELQNYKDKVNRSLDRDERSIMMDPKLIEIKNEIYKKIKFFKMKKAHLPDFVRKKRDSILTTRLDHEKTASLQLAEMIPDLNPTDRFFDSKLQQKF